MGYGIITDEFYDHPRIKALERDGIQVFTYLCANRHTHYSGVYFLPIADISKDLKMPDNDVRYWLEILTVGPAEFPVDQIRLPGGFGYLIEFDWERSIVWVRGMLKAKMNPERLNQRQRTGMTKYLTKFNNSPLVGRFIAYYAAASIPMPKGYDIPHSDGVSGTLFGRGIPRKVLRFEG